MVRLSNLLVASLALFNDVVSAKSAVLDLIPTNFDKVVHSGKPGLVEFFAPWCGHCRTLAPVYEQLGQAFAHASDKVHISKVDADAHKSLGKKHKVQGFPTLKWFDGKGGNGEEYEGGRDLEALAKFITDKTGVKAKGMKKAAESVVTMLTDQSFAKEVGGDRDVFVAFTAPWCGHCKTLAPIWETLTEDFIREPGVLIAKVDAEAEQSKATARDQKVTGYPTIKFFPKGSKEGEIYSGARSEEAFVNFLNEKCGTNRAVGGGLNAKGGTIEALDAIVAKYVSGEALEKIIKDIKAAVGALKQQYAQYYLKVATKLSQNSGYAAKELARLQKMISKGSLAPEKLDDLTSRSNVLRQFLGKEAKGTKDEL
ncbi:protein disulfide-isomerase tigA [Uncinocarpus reesii 1704]|uniref:protein disulfide-isomerase n=1 Tax=Uncinocarpus reesii (strain UAMH 1704) TaxID=336963 RepID=C4JRF1_UNCRE|nr:protein disulfide-isomerase tigA [Uncinocarpus reesii 1704]EEP80198.1 protein disulfide-isomerase tigA [Uncinocarpus reesii 1704]